MKTINSKRGRPEVAQAVIEALGVEGLMRESQLSADDKPISAATVTFYKQNGLPIFFEKFLRLRYPNLKAWEIGGQK